MGIQSTQYISRDSAIIRIEEICLLAWSYDYIEVENVSYESDYSVETFLNDFQLTRDQVQNIEKWTNTMLEAYMDQPFFRLSMFDNYIIKGGTK